MPVQSLPVLLLAALLFASIGSSAQAQPTPTGDPWVIRDDQTCTGGRLVVDRNITIEAGGILRLRGCTLALRSHAYVDRPFPQSDEGLILRVRQGGSLILESFEGRPAVIEREDPRYGYNVRSAGSVISLGEPGTLNVIRGIEGAHQGNLVLGGFQTRTGHFAYTRFENGTGPVVATREGEMTMDHVEFGRGGGIASLGARRLTLSNLTMDSPYSSVFASSTPRVEVRECTLRGGFKPLYFAGSNVSVTRCSIVTGPKDGVALYAEDSTVHVADSTLDYSMVGAQFLFKDRRNALPNRFTAENVTVRAFGPEAKGAVEVQAGRLEIRDSVLLANGTAVHALESDVLLRGNRVEGNASTFINAKSLEYEGQTSASPAFGVWRITRIHVTDGGVPVGGATVRLGGTSGPTTSEGLADVLWRWYEADEADGFEGPEKVTLQVTDPATNRTRSFSRDADAALMSVDLSASEEGWSGSTIAWIALGVVAAIGLAAWFFMGRSKP